MKLTLVARLLQEAIDKTSIEVKGVTYEVTTAIQPNGTQTFGVIAPTKPLANQLIKALKEKFGIHSTKIKKQLSGFFVMAWKYSKEDNPNSPLR